MKALLRLLALFLIFVTCILCKGQNKTEVPKDTIKSETKEVSTPHGFPYGPYSETYSGPNSITRTIIQDRKGNIWMASWQGVFRYDGKVFTNMTSKVSSARYFSALEDSNGNLWFGSIGSGVYRYDGKSFRNYMMDGDSIMEDTTGKSVADFTRPPHEVNSIIEDKTGKFWFGTRGHTFVYDGKSFKTATHNGQPFKNVRTIIEDKKGNIWLGGADGLWLYDRSTFANITQNFVGYIYEDKKGNIWTSSETTQGWVLSRYDEKSLSNEEPTATEINPNDGRMLFGILEANDGSIWFGADGAYRYDGKTITDFKSKEGH